MEINGIDRCIGCMRPLDQNGTCSHCHFPQTEYRPAPRCMRPGCRLSGRYVLGKVLGEGSFGITYIAWDTLLDMVVAVKEYFPNGVVSRYVSKGNDYNIYLYEKREKRNYQDDLDKYLQEAKRLSAFSELDGIVSVRDFFYENQTAYMVMSFVDGISLKEYVEKNGRIEGKLFLEMLRPLLVSLSKVHEKGMLHRDISPDNMLVTEEHRLVLVDFGAARRENINLSHSMTVVFKRGYSPEEQYRTRGKQGAWTDIYALCATAYYALTGIRPDEAIERILEDELRPLTELQDLDLTDSQKKAFMKGMAVQPEERYQSVQEMYDALYRVREASVGKWHRSRRLAVLTAFALAGLILFGIWQRGKLMAGTLQTTSENNAADPAYGQQVGLTGEDGQTGLMGVDGQAETAGTGREPDEAADRAVKNASGTGVSTDAEEKAVVPAVKGMERKLAVKRLKKKGFRVAIRKQHSGKIQKGFVISQSIPGDRTRKKGVKITLILSDGPKTTSPPAATPQPTRTIPEKTSQSSGERQDSQQGSSGGNSAGKEGLSEDDFSGKIP